MASLIQRVLESVTDSRQQLTAEQSMSQFDLDIDAVSDVEGGWEYVTRIDGCWGAVQAVTTTGFINLRTDGPAVYAEQHYIVVRGFSGCHNDYFWLVYEPAGVGIH